MNTKTVIAGIAGTAAAGAVAATALRRGGDGQDGAEPPQAELRQHLTDMIALNNHVLTTLRRQLDATDVDVVPLARDTLEEVEKTLDGHLIQLEAELELLGGGGQSALKSVAGGVMGVTASVIDRFRTEPVSRMYRDDYVALSLVAISYSMLHTTALTLGHQSLADVTQLCLEQTTPLVVRMSDEMPHIVVAEIEQQREGATHDDAGMQAEEHSHEAWQQGAQQEHQGF